MWNQTIFDKYNLLYKIKSTSKSLASLLFHKLSDKNQLIIHNFITSEERLFYKKNEKFDSVFFELRTRCNSKCSFCAASIQNEIRPDITMKFDLFAKGIDYLSNENYDKRIAFHVNNDPLLVKNLHEYVAYARAKCPKAWIQILTNGKSLRNENGYNILKAGIDELSINIYEENRTEETPKNIINFEKDVLYKLYDKKNVLGGMPGVILKKKYPTYIKYTKARRLVDETLSNRAGSAPNKKSNKTKPNLGFCSHPFSQVNITTNGDVSQCCADFYFNNKMGNIKHNSLNEIWSGEKFTKLRENLNYSNRKENILCSNCDHFGINKLPNSFLKRQLYKLLFINDE